MLACSQVMAMSNYKKQAAHIQSWSSTFLPRSQKPSDLRVHKYADVRPCCAGGLSLVTAKSYCKTQVLTIKAHAVQELVCFSQRSAVSELS